MEDEEIDDEREKWENERQKVLDEWSEIELKGKDALNLDIIHEPGTSADLVPSELALEELFPLLINHKSISENETDEITTFVPSSTIDRILQVCLCRPIKAQLPPLVYTHKSLMLKLSRAPYDNENGTHWLLLSDYFQTIAKLALDTPDTPCVRVGPHWQIVGFQGNNPATDFRGAGILALIQLHYFSQQLPHNILKAIVQLSRLEPNDFPLAVVSINITGLILSKLKKDRLDCLGNATEGLYPAVAKLHAASLAKFCAQYKSQNLTLAQCQTILTELDQILEKSPSTLISLLDPSNDELIKHLL